MENSLFKKEQAITHTQSFNSDMKRHIMIKELHSHECSHCGEKVFSEHYLCSGACRCEMEEILRKALVNRRNYILRHDKS